MAAVPEVEIPFKKIVVHPIVLLHAVDHYNRVAKDTKKRVVGILLGETHKGVIEATSSYALPFEEDERDPSIWFLDHSYHETMYAMCRKVNVREKLVGWYTTGPKIRAGDLQIDRLVRRYTKNPVMVIIDVKPKELGIPTEAYFAVEVQPPRASPPPTRLPIQWPSPPLARAGDPRGPAAAVDLQAHAVRHWRVRGASPRPRHLPPASRPFLACLSPDTLLARACPQSEEVGVEHLLRDVKDMTISTLANQVTQKLGALKGLASRLKEVDAYLQNVLSGRLPVNHQIIYGLQDVFNLLPNTNVDELVKAFAVKTNDMMLAMYLSSIIRSVLALHNLINNKLYNKEKQRAADEGDGKEKEKAEGKDAKDGKESKDEAKDKAKK
tara:strand:+ start:2058 stop:3203 length:1146 start_codon:yes stop_codon:yes gene_type:complete